MKLLNKQYFGNDNYTLSRFYVDGVYMCDVLEDAVRKLPKICPDTPKGVDCRCKEKVYGRTAIPAGTYKCAFTYSNKFKRKLLLILDVPHFLGIRQHRGNTEKDTLGCLIVGENKAKGKVLNSTIWENRLNKIYEEAAQRGEEITIEIVRL